MTRPNITLLLLTSAGLLTSCSTPRLILDRTHPASVDAPEASTAPARSTLHADENTQRTRELLEQRERQAKAAEDEAPADQTQINPNAPKPANAPSPKMKMPGHEHH